MNRFSGKTVIVTGASSGIGAAAARRFSSEGANLVAISRSDDRLAAVVEGMPEERTLRIACDTSDPEQAERAVAATIERFGQVDVLINNAGTATRGDIEETSREEFDRVLAVNVGGYFHMARAAMPHLRKTAGSIVMTSSVSGLGGDWQMVAYNASKGAVSNMVRAIALDAGQHGVRVNAVNPSLTDTGMTKDIQTPEQMEAFLERFAIKRIGKPEDVAAAMAFLASDDAAFITGVNLPVDGGLSASNGQPPQ